MPLSLLPALGLWLKLGNTKHSNYRKLLSPYWSEYTHKICRSSAGHPKLPYDTTTSDGFEAEIVQGFAACYREAMRPAQTSYQIAYMNASQAWASPKIDDDRAGYTQTAGRPATRAAWTRNDHRVHRRSPAVIECSVCRQKTRHSPASTPSSEIRVRSRSRLDPCGSCDGGES